MSESCEPTTDGSERRIFERFDVSVPMGVHKADDDFRWETENVSAGGACLVAGDGGGLKIGDHVELSVEVPGAKQSMAVEAEVRWLGGRKKDRRVGVMFRGRKAAAFAACLAGWMGVSGAANAADSAGVPTFDPSADVVLDMNAGGERPDEFQLLQAFEQQYSEFDKCVNAAKSSRRQLQGDVEVSMLLNPKGELPLGLNTTMPRSVSGNKRLNKCLRTAIASADYPSYDGVPVVVTFNFELDPGEEFVEDDDY